MILIPQSRSNSLAVLRVSRPSKEVQIVKKNYLVLKKILAMCGIWCGGRKVLKIAKPLQTERAAVVYCLSGADFLINNSFLILREKQKINILPIC